MDIEHHYTATKDSQPATDTLVTGVIMADTKQEFIGVIIVTAYIGVGVTSMLGAGIGVGVTSMLGAGIEVGVIKATVADTGEEVIEEGIVK